MNYPLRERTETDHNNSGIIMDGLLMGMTPEEFVFGMSEEAVPLMEKFNVLWDTAKDHLQQPVQNDSLRYGGFTGHRIVTFEDKMGRCALGFQLARNGHDLYRSIVATRRKVYSDNRRRQVYASSELAISAKEVASGPESLRIRYDLGVLATWLDKYNSAS